ncbi:MAG: purine-binding chemotaxis protein CheW [Deltaproteobacteria bacterium]|nr:purine-binding chemotaxis protein CheW [Deltaproteobacteria bacterium]
MKQSNRYVVFSLDGQRYALHLSAVERVIRVVEMTSLPKTPDIVLGIVNVEGQIIPIVNIRKRFRLPERELDLSDVLIIAQIPRRTVALVADNVSGVIEGSEQDITEAKEIFPRMEYVKGVVKLKDGLVLIHDLDKFLSLEEDKELDSALKKKR